MDRKELAYKIYKRLHKKLIQNRYGKVAYQKYCRLYPSYRHSLKKNGGAVSQNAYIAARPNPGAGIGHQMANYIAGLYFSKKFEIPLAYIPFSSLKAPFVPNDWDALLGFGDGEVWAKDLKGYKKVLLPLFDEKKEEEVKVIEKIIRSYGEEKVLFLFEQDQFFMEQYPVMDTMQEKFYQRAKKREEKLIFNPEEYNIAVHVRRGDIVQKPGENNPNHTMRWIDNDYFVNAIRSALLKIKTEKKIHIYIFSQGNPSDYPEFGEFQNVTFCTDMGAKESFLHMVYADALIISKSSFSYKPALLSRGLKFCPKDFWHAYPEQEDWILLDNMGKEN